MSFVFQGSNRPTIGVEIELQILDPLSLDLTPQAEKILEVCRQLGIDRVKSEVHQSMIEIDSEVSNDVKECRNFLMAKLQQLSKVANSMGLKLAVTGTHPFQRWAERLISNGDRYQHLHEKFQWLIRRMNIYGMHVHVGVSSGSRALQILNCLVPYLPHLLALSANSPFWQGIDTGMNSSRISILEAFPYAGIPPYFNGWKDFERFYQTLNRVGAIDSLKDLYWYIRPNLSYGTLEFRICDGMSTLSETMALAAFIHCLVVWADEELICIESPLLEPLEYQWIIRENQWTAARDGLDAMIIENSRGKRRKISDAILDLISNLEPIATKLNCREELSFVRSLIQNGNGAQRQRRSYNSKQSLHQVVALGLEEFEANLSI